ncbi:MAG: polysaccharide deacetylase family protein [Blastocatellia bacterium]
MKQTVLNLMRVTGAFAPFRRANRDKALILTYHRFSNTGAAEATSARAFAEQIRYLTSHYQIVPLSNLAEYLSRGVGLPAGIASIAIDDGYRDAYEIAFPILTEYKIPATLFVVTDFLDRRIWLWTDKLRFILSRTESTEFSTTIDNRAMQFRLGDRASRTKAAAQINAALKRLPDQVKDQLITDIEASLGVELPAVPTDDYAAISWNQAREMDAAGVRIGSHTVSHPILTRVSGERLRIELSESRSRIQLMLGREVDLFCYPNGDYNESISQAVRDAGYKCAVTVEPGFNNIDSDPLQLRRVHTDNNLARFIQSTSGFEQIKNRVVSDRRATAASSY